MNTYIALNDPRALRSRGLVRLLRVLRVLQAGPTVSDGELVLSHGQTAVKAFMKSRLQIALLQAVHQELGPVPDFSFVPPLESPLWCSRVGHIGQTRR